jgi:hypothetical protein
MFFKILLSTPESSAYLDALWRLTSTDADRSMNGLINYFAALSAKTRSAYIQTFMEPIAATATVTFNGLPTATQTYSIGNNIYTAVASGATGTQFNIGATAAETANNFMLAIRGYATARPVYRASVNGAVVTITAQEPGAFGNTITVSTALSNVVTTTFTGGSDGIVDTLACGYNSLITNGTYSEILVQTDLTALQLEGLLNVQSTDVQGSLNRIINYFQMLQSGDRSALVICRRGMTTASYQLVATGQPNSGETLQLNRMPYNAAASGAVSPNFNIGGTVPVTLANLSTVINTAVSQVRVYGFITSTVLTASALKINTIMAGGVTEAFRCTENFTNMALVHDVTGTNGVQSDLSFGYDITQTLPRSGEDEDVI